MKNKIMTVTHCALAWLITLTALVLAMFLTSLVPNDAIAENTAASADWLMKTAPTNYIIDKNHNSIQDNYADAVLLGVIANVDSGSPFETMINTRYHDGENYGEAYGIYVSLAGYAPNTDYTRYWHGSMTVLRPLLAVTDLNGIRLIGGIALALLIIADCVFLVRKKMLWAAVVFIVSLAAVHVWLVPFSVEYTITFIIMTAAIPFYISFADSDKKLLILSAAVGTVTAFADFLTTETITLLVPILLVFFIRMRSDADFGFKGGLTLTLKNAVSWGAAYLLTFVSKWCIASAVTGENKFVTALTAAEERATGETGFGNLAEQLFSALGANLTMLFPGGERINAGALLIGLLVYTVIIAAVVFVVKWQPRKGVIPFLAIIAAVPLVRFLVLSNHSYLHSHFTYRALIITFIAVLGALCLSSPIINPPPRKSGKGGKRGRN